MGGSGAHDRYQGGVRFPTQWRYFACRSLAERGEIIKPQPGHLARSGREARVA
jgi:hypothetical protein